MKSISSFFRIKTLLVLPFLLWCGAAAFDPGESSSGDGFSKSSRFQNQGSMSAISSSQSDLDPYVSDNAVVDSLYKVGPGDLFQISFETSSIEKQVNVEGNIILNQIGIVPLQGLTLKEAKQRILDHLQTTFKRSNCFVNLRLPKTMRIFVTGAVNMPGTFDVPGNYRLSDALRIAEGFSSQAQKGSIQIQSVENNVQTVSILKFVKQGDLTSNPYLTQGCIIKVPYIDFDKPWVTVARDSGSFVVQIEPGENVLDAFEKSHPLISSKPVSPEPFTAFLVRGKNGKDSLLSPSTAAMYQPKSEDRIEVLSFKQEVYVGGAVTTPGYQPYHSDRKIIQYISRAGLLSSSKISENINVVRKDGTRETVSLHEGVLHPGDVVYVKQNFEQKFLLYTPILLSLVSLTLALLSLNAL